MEENRKKLHALIDSIADNGTLEYLVTFVSLFLEKWGTRYETRTESEV